MLPDRFIGWIRERVAIIVAHTLGRTRITASALTVIGTILMSVAAWLLMNGCFLWAAITITGASMFDVLDGALARVKGTQSAFGAFLDSTLDRYAEVLIYGGLIVYYSSSSTFTLENMLVYATVTGSLLTSYIRARAESTGYSCSVGIVERPERLIILIIGLFTNYVLIALIALTVLTHITAIQRFIHVWSQYRRGHHTNEHAKSTTVTIKSSN
jgi:CDP-diacylglycerol--glycerol-3-phosphate 3-phosphatidyltransferase